MEHPRSPVYDVVHNPQEFAENSPGISDFDLKDK